MATRWRRRHGQTGQRGMASLPEILVALGVFAAASAIVTAIILQANQVSRTTTASTQTQAMLLDAVSRVSRDIAFSDPVLSAPSGNEVWTQTMQGADCQRTRYWVAPDRADSSQSGLWSESWTATNTNCADAAAPAPSDPGDGPAKEIVADLVLPAGAHVFTYYDVDQAELAPPVADPSTIKRIGVNLSATVADRKTPLTLATSATPRNGYPDGSGPVAGARPSAPTGLISSGCRTDGTVTLNWTAVAGATGYTVLRDGVSQQPVLLGGTSTTFNQSGLVNGRSYAYQVLADNASGLSDLSGSTTVTCAPGTIALSGATVAADADKLVNDNRLTWIKPVNQVVTGYNLYKDGAPLATVNGASTLTYTDRNVPWGETHAYTVRAFNAQGEGADSNAVSLLTAPPAPTISGTATDDQWDRLTWTPSPTADCYRVYRDGTLYWQFNDTRTAANDGQAYWASTHTYQVAACNASGEGPKSNPITLKQKPGPFDIVGGSTSQWRKYNWCGGSPYTCHTDSNSPGGATVSWTWSSGATNYTVSMGGTRFGVGNSNSTGFRNATPGSTVAYQITATAANGLTRTSSTKTVLVPPTPPANVHASTWCNLPVNDNGWKYGMDIWMGPVYGSMDFVHIIETQYAASGVDGSGLPTGWAWYGVVRESYIAPYNNWGTYAWGGLPDPGGATVIPNTKWNGGGMLVEGFKNGAANYGNNWSSRLGVDGAIKQATGPVACNRGWSDGWGYNGNAAVIFNLDWFGP